MNMHKFSLAYLTVPGVTPAEQTYMAADAGYDYVSFRLFHLDVAGEPDIDPVSPQVVRDARRALDETGLKCLDLELLRITRDLDHTAFRPAFEAAASLGATQAICSAWTDVRNDRAYVTDQFSKICALAAEYGMCVNLEFPAFSRLTTLSEVVEILEFADAPNAGILVDTLYMHFNRLPLVGLERIPRRWINFMHICDAQNVVFTKDEMIQTARDARLYPGEGAIDFSAINELFPNLPLSIELPNASRSKEFGHPEHARRCLKAARDVLNSAPQFKNGKVPSKFGGREEYNET